ncbi:hypothetical protein, partial [Janthinobacterium sp. BJB301]|uniref:hypothetical protein n=1 Tax=Janthinobacterium sp. BJB301 TaxID=1560195 RepID=UPI0015D4C8FD
ADDSAATSVKVGYRQACYLKQQPRLLFLEKNPISNGRVFFRLVIYSPGITGNAVVKLCFIPYQGCCPRLAGADLVQLPVNPLINRQASMARRAFRMVLPGQFDSGMTSHH